MLLLLLFSLLLVTSVSPSHYYGGRTSVTYGGRNPNGSWKVVFRYRATFDGHRQHYWNCYSGNCGTREAANQMSNLGCSTIASPHNSRWCESETVSVRNIPSDRPFTMRAGGCCWIPTRTRNFGSGWRLMATVDLGKRSDTNEPNRSPDVAILPLIRVPQNCPRTYQLIPYDADGDHVRCRYANLRMVECSGCNQFPGFQLDEDSCTLRYHRTTADTKVHPFEMIVEDFPRAAVTLRYTDGSRTTRSPPHIRRRRSLYPSWFFTAAPPWWMTTQRSTTTESPSTTTPWRNRQWFRTTRPWRPWWLNTQRPTTTTSPPTTAPWRNRQRFRTISQWSPWWLNTQRPTTTESPSTTARWRNRQWFRTTRPWRPWWLNTQRPTTTASPPTTAPWTNAQRFRTPWWWAPRQTTTHNPTTTMPPMTTNYQRRNTQPLSKVPLQFSFLVDPPAPSCQEGVYVPRLLPPTPPNGALIRAEVDGVLEIMVKAQSSVSRIIDIIFSGPQGMTKHQRSNGEFVLRWTPTSADLGMKVPMCFAVDSGHGSLISVRRYGSPITRPSRIYQSEMRCVKIEVPEDTVRREVSCAQSTMTIAIEKASVPGLRLDHLKLTDDSNVVCSFRTHSNSTHAVATFPLNACGTQIEENNEKLIFKNEVTSVDNQGDLITRKHLLELDFLCEYPKHGNVTLGFKTHRMNVTVWEKGFGMFTYDFEFYEDTTYRSMISPSLYPVDVDIGSRIYMQIEATSSINNTELFVESCRASPYDNPNYRPTYSIIENGCTVDQTVTIHNPDHPNEFRFSMEAFKFIGLHDQVYISCSVIVCERGSPNTRCAQGCVRANQPNRAKREASVQTANHFISQGPLRLKRSAEGAIRTSPNANLNLNMNLVFIVGALLAGVVIISLMSYLKKRISSVKYQPLPTDEK